ncbi:protein CBFA2T1-like isoform X6 [Ptychodera flava]|uniref:protein CBFA2T1-like isoform X6 n=1 Tax=Ptychodera flava TaxID=63121 RepID=UPI003969D58A
MAWWPLHPTHGVPQTTHVHAMPLPQPRPQPLIHAQHHQQQPQQPVKPQQAKRDYIEPSMPDSPTDQGSSKPASTQPQCSPTGQPPVTTMSVATHSRSVSTSSGSGSIVNGLHSPNSVNGTPSPPSSMANSVSASQELPPACGARQLSKLKRFLTTLQQFGTDISPEIGERVRSLVMALVNNQLSVEEFHNKLQEATNFPLRPFVIPFLKANLPLLQRELMHCARMAKMTPHQYYSQHEHLLLDTKASPVDSSDILMEVNENGKRRTPERVNTTPKENGREPLQEQHLAKRHCTVSPSNANRTSPSSTINHHGSAAPHPIRMEDLAHAREMRERELRERELRERDLREREMREFSRFERDRERHHPIAAGGIHNRESMHPSSEYSVFDDRVEDDWKHVDTMLQCIMGMVEKTKRAIAVLHQRSLQDREELALWVRRHAEGAEHDMKKRAGEMMAHTIRQTEDRVSEVKRRAVFVSAEEAVNEVKRQAVAELQKAVAAAEQKANELVAAERAKLERAVSEAKKQGYEEANATINSQDDTSETGLSSSQSCWNCGRKANETCSGCNTARYCGSFCQHKDWENHHRMCAQVQAQQQQQGGSADNNPTTSVPTTTTTTPPSAATSPAGSNANSASRSSTPALASGGESAR